MKRTGALLLLSLVAVRPGSAGHFATPCENPNADPWVTDVRSRVLEFDGLAAFAIELYGTPVSCEGEVTAEFDGQPFGFLRLGFADGAVFEIQTQPPESSVATLRVPAGFPDVAEARRTLESYAADIGLEIDWSNRSVTTENGARVEVFWDREEGRNASVALIFLADELVGLRLSLAL